MILLLAPSANLHSNSEVGLSRRGAQLVQQAFARRLQRSSFWRSKPLSSTPPGSRIHPVRLRPGRCPRQSLFARPGSSVKRAKCSRGLWGGGKFARALPCCKKIRRTVESLPNTFHVQCELNFDSQITLPSFPQPFHDTCDLSQGILVPIEIHENLRLQW